MIRTAGGVSDRRLDSVRALVCHRFGSLQDLALEQIPIEPPGPEEVRVRVAFVGLNHPDVLLVKGLYQERPSLPFVPGGELSGTVVEVGERVRDLAVGASVMAITYRGALAEQVNLPANKLRRLPGGMPLETAACFQGVYATAFYSLALRARLREGESVLVLGGSGGLGMASVQVARALGARVIAGVSSREGAEFARDHGAMHCIDYSTESLRERVRELTGGRGVDVTIDPVGGRLFSEAVRTVAWNGRYVVVGFASGVIGSLPANLPLLKGYSLIGAYYGRFCELEPLAAEQVSEAVEDLYRRALVCPPITAIFPFDAVVEALCLLEQRRARGKIAVSLGGGAP